MCSSLLSSHYAPSEEGSTLKGKNLVPLGGLCFMVVAFPGYLALCYVHMELNILLYVMIL